MSYVELLPDDLLTEICYYLNYTQSILVIEIFNYSEMRTIDINYNYLLKSKYPGFYKLFTLVKSKDIRYRNYGLEKAYELINNLSSYIRVFKSYIKIYNKLIVSDNPEDINILVILKQIKFVEIEDMVCSYNIIIRNTSNLIPDKYFSKLYKYKVYFPNIPNSNKYFKKACIEHMSIQVNFNTQIYDLSSISRSSVEYEDKLYSLLYSIFLEILIEPSIIKNLRLGIDTLMTIIYRGNYKPYYSILYSCITEYIENRDNLQSTTFKY